MFGEDGSVAVSAERDGDEALAVIEGATWTGGALSIDFNPTYLRLMASGLAGENVTLELQERRARSRARQRR